MSGLNEGEISNGEPYGSLTGTFCLVPKSFIVARNISYVVANKKTDKKFDVEKIASNNKAKIFGMDIGKANFTYDKSSSSTE
jgi:hypothetical protein